MNSTTLKPSRPPYLILAIASLLGTISNVYKFGIEVFHEDYFMSVALNRRWSTNIDLFATLVSSAPPFAMYLFKSIYDIPFYHFALAFFVRTVCAFFFGMLSWTITRSLISTVVSVLGFLAVADFRFFNLNLPGTLSWVHVKYPLYLSFRSVALLLIIVAILYFIRGAWSRAAVFLGAAFYIHPTNVLSVALTLWTILVLQTVWLNRSAVSWREPVKFAVLFSVVIVPRLFSYRSAFGEIASIPFVDFWKFVIKNEPDDVSALYYFTELSMWGMLGLSLLATMLYVGFAKQRQTKLIEGKAVPSTNLLISCLVVPWIVFLASVVYEAFLYKLAPDQVNDVLMVMETRRATTISVLIYIPIITQTIIGIGKIALNESTRQLAEVWPIVHRRVEYHAENLSYFFCISLCCASFFLVFVKSPGIPFSRLWDFQHRPFEYFLSLERESEGRKVYYHNSNVKSKNVMPLSALIDICEKIRLHTSSDDGLIAPTYIKEFRAYAQRQVFLSEKFDGNYAILNRKMATIYLRRFGNIHGGLTYADLPGIVFEGEKPYDIMRENFLSLTRADVDELKRQSAGFRYFVTEIGHALGYPVVASNDYFVVYDIGAS